MTTATTSDAVIGQTGEDVFPRLQLALNVPDLEAAIAFYNQLFNAEPAKVRPGYANYALSNPALKLVLFENPDAPERLNHLGVEVASPGDVVSETQRVGALMPVEIEEGTTCCHALQDKFWVHGPDRTKWEVYTVLADAQLTEAEAPKQAAGSCGPDECC